ncbi:YceI family protein [Sphingomonas sp. LY29]|uniref:YceI family protein n=1 Tax=unclassified Sphingomonas TaxID=196159 RepID=UPI002ADEC43D|nr:MULTISPECIES: YceI family protein [unclassified Sphingomonas]MEA1073289.1 YceI family protein [Sphingomonas sp. LY160]WRP26397.1 YceI family protein [Sphingomonas sp. LY29]
MAKKMIMISVICVTALSGAAWAQTGLLTRNPTEARSGLYVLDPAHGKITWSVSHMGFSTYAGQFTNVFANLDLNVEKPSASRLNATVMMESAGTFSKGLDQHLQTADFFDTKNHPATTFRASSIRIVDRDTASISGDLTLRGVTRPIVIKADFNQAGVSPADKKYTVGFDGEAKIKRSDFGIIYGLPLLGDEVTLRLEAEFKLQEPS